MSSESTNLALAVRLASPDDLPAVVSVYNESIPGRMATADTRPVTTASRERWFTERDPERHPILVAIDAEEVVGWIALSPFFNTRPAYFRTAEISLYVTNRLHRAGVGHRLYQELEQRWERTDLVNIVALIFGHNAPSLRFYEKQGFLLWGNLPRVAELDEIERDVVILGKRIR